MFNAGGEIPAPSPKDSEFWTPSPTDADNLLSKLKPGLTDRPSPADKAASTFKPKLAETDTDGGGMQAYTLR